MNSQNNSKLKLNKGAESLVVLFGSQNQCDLCGSLAKTLGATDREFMVTQEKTKYIFLSGAQNAGLKAT